MALKIRRGLESARTSITPADGEIIYTTDENKIYVGDGTTAGGDLVAGQKGEVGAAGSDGSSGAKGEVGAAGSDGSSGAKGQKGEVGVTGADGADGADAVAGDGLPTQTDNSGKFLTTNGTAASWATVSAGAGYEIGDGLELDSVTSVDWDAAASYGIDGVTADKKLGTTITASADYVVVGYKNHDRVEVYNARTGAFLRSIICPDGANQNFGNERRGLQIDGTRLIVGAFLARKAYIFDVSDGSLLHTLTSTKEQFGHTVSIKGNYAAVTSKYDSAYTRDISVYDVTTGSELYTISNPNVETSSSGDSFGAGYLSLTPSYIVTSAQDEDVGAINSGTLYIFDITDGTLVCTRSEPAQLQFGYYGAGLSADGDRLAISRHTTTIVEDGSTRNVPRVELHSITALISDPLSDPYLVITDPNAGGLGGWNNQFGYNGPLSISGNYVAVGARDRNLYPNGGTPGEIYTATQSGAAYLFNATDGTLLATKLGTTGGEFVGFEVAVASGVFAWSAPNKNSNLGFIGINAGDITTNTYLQPDSTIATTSYVDTSVSNLVDSSPAALNTLNELAAALGDDANFSTTVTNSIATKAPLADPTFTGVPAAPTAAAGTNTTQLATTAFVAAANAAAGDGLPTQTDNSGKFLTTDGTDASWGTAPIPDKLLSSSTTTSVYSTASVTPSSVVSHAQVYGWGLDSTYTIIGQSIDKLHVYSSSNMSFIKTITLAGIQYQGTIRSIAVANGKCLVAMPSENSNTGRLMLVDISSGSVLWNKTGSNANTLSLLGRGEVSLTSTHAAIIHHEGTDGLGYGNVRIYDIAGNTLWDIAGTSGSTLDNTSLALNSTHFAYSINPGASAQIVVRSLATGEVTATIAAPSGADSSYMYVPGGASSNAMGMSETHIAATAYSQVSYVGGVAHTGVVHVWDLAGNITNTFVSPTSQANMGGALFGWDGVKVEGDIVVTAQAMPWSAGTAMPTTTTSDALQFYSISADSHTHTATYSNSASTTINQAWGSLVRYNEGVAGATMGDTSPYHVQTFALGSSDLTTYQYLTAATIATKAPLADPTFTGTVTLPQTAEVSTALTGATGTVTHDLSNSALFVHSSISADFTANFTNVPTTDDRTTSVALVLVQGGTAYIPTALQINGSTQTILWQGSAAPTGTASKHDIVSFSLIRSGGAWTVVGSLTTYGA